MNVNHLRTYMLSSPSMQYRLLPVLAAMGLGAALSTFAVAQPAQEPRRLRKLQEVQAVAVVASDPKFFGKIRAG